MATLNDQTLYALTQKYFGDLGQNVVDTMFRIAKRESGGNASAYNGTGLDRSHGLWQINVHPKANPDLASWNLEDPETNAKAARLVYDRQGPTAWSTYQGGSSMPSQMTPQQQIEAALQALMQNPPSKDDYVDDTGIFDSAGYKAATSEWTSSITSMIDLAKYYRDQQAGVFTLPDGTIVTQDYMDSLDPATRQQVEAQLANQNVARQNQFNDAMNALGLTEWTTNRTGVTEENARRSTDFQNQMEAYRENLALDKANQDTVINRVDRQLKGMQEASSRASTTMDALLKAAPWATSNGKTAFTGNDFGAAGAKLAGYAGLNPNDVALTYTGTQTLDPNAIFNAYDSALGVSGPLPEIPGLTTTAGMIPSAPSSIPVPQGAPSFLAPNAPWQMDVPQASVPPPPDIRTAAAQSAISQGIPQQLTSQALGTGDIFRNLLGLMSAKVNARAQQRQQIASIPAQFTPLTGLPNSFLGRY